MDKLKLKSAVLKFPIFVQERTIVDAFRYLSLGTAIKALKTAITKKGKDKINYEKLINYSKVLRVNIEPYLLAVAA